MVRTIVALATVLLVGAETTAGPLLAKRGRARLPIVVAADASTPEQTAAEELARYLGEVAGCRFRVRRETARTRRRPGIFVGATGFAVEHGLDPGEMGGEGWGIRTIGPSVVLYGGHPRGTLYAVYHLLEDVVGVRWWNPFEEDVPRLRTLRLPKLALSGSPRFAYRDVRGIGTSGPFCARSRLNGHFSGLAASWGGRIGYGPPAQVHTFYHYVPPEEFFETHPEFFSELDGVRTAHHGQLCLTNRALLDLVTSRLERFIKQASDEPSPPQLFDISENDWGGACQCPVCLAAASRGGGRAAVLLEFVNAVADRVRDRHPDVRIDTLAYAHTVDPPRALRPRENVIVRLAGLYERDFSRPISATENDEYRHIVEAWSEIARTLRIWDYTTPFSDFGELPLPNERALVEDYRFYAAHGIDGAFVQHEFPVAGDMWDLKLWVLARTLEDPARDADRLIREFTDGYYGAAAAQVRAYRELLARAREATEGVIGYQAMADDYDYLDRRVVLAAHRLLDEARERVAGDAALARRVRHAGLALDRATLVRWRHLVSHENPERDLAWVESVARRYRRTWHEQIDLRLAAGRRARRKAEVDEELDGMLAVARRLTR